MGTRKHSNIDLICIYNRILLMGNDIPGEKLILLRVFFVFVNNLKLNLSSDFHFIVVLEIFDQSKV